MERQKGYYIKYSYPNDFVDFMEELYKKYGEEIFEIQGIANKHLDLAHFSQKFFKKSSESVSDVSVDANANVNEKNVTQYSFENNKASMKLNSLFIMYKTIKKLFSLEDAQVALEKVVNGELFVNDLHTYAHLPYCYAFDLRVLLSEGMNFFKGNMKIGIPKRSDSFIQLLIQSVAYISNQIAGAASFPDFFPVLDWFYRKELGENYMKEMSGDQKDKILNQFQGLIYSLNFPFRGGQSAFTNLSMMDKGFMESLFDGYFFPDYTAPNIDSSIELSKMFFEYFSDIYSKEGIFTFPVTTLAISLDKDNNYLDPEFVKWAAKVNAPKSIANIFQSLPDSFSSCCRLKNNYSTLEEVGYQNSFGVGGLSVGSHRVAGFNLPRIALMEKENPGIIEEDLDILHKILLAHRHVIRTRIEGGHLPLYKHGWIDLNKQYSTIGFIGGYEYVRNNGYQITDKDGISLLVKTLSKIEDKIKIWQKEEKEQGNIYNIEQIPAESVAVRSASIDKILGFSGAEDWELYSNQYIPLIEDASIYDRMRIQGELDQLTSGGSILHINVDDEKPIGDKEFYNIMDTARKLKVCYFAINYAYSESSMGVYSIGKHDTCPINGDPIVTQYTRVVGFVTPVRAWNSIRKNYEYPKRVFYKNDDVGNLQ